MSRSHRNRFKRGQRSPDSDAVPYGRLLNQLHLVCKSFHGILTDYVHVDGVPIRDRLMDLRMLKFTNFVESVATIKSYLEASQERFHETCRCRVEIDGDGIVETCGFVGKNVQFRKLYCELLHPSTISLF